MPDDHSEVVPPLPIPNRTVKHLSADDSGQISPVKVGHRQASYEKTPEQLAVRGFLYFQQALNLLLIGLQMQRFTSNSIGSSDDAPAFSGRWMQRYASGPSSPSMNGWKANESLALAAGGRGSSVPTVLLHGSSIAGLPTGADFR